MQKKAGSALHKIAACILMLSVLWQPLAQAVAETVSSVSVEAAPLTTSSTAVDGMVRVYLSSLGSPTTLTVTIAGSYSLSTGTSLTSGESLTVGFSSATGAITLTRNGTKTNMGTYFSLRRHSASGSNGVLISQARKPSNPYPGDLSFQAVQQSGGTYKLYTVAHVYIEDYLYGVLPYEMGSSANAEALKAQAVAARTYTVRMMNSRSGGYYDVVDTTSDQVYNGTPSSNATCVAAVTATKGIVLKNGSAYTATYYSASNGGQTESILNIWGTTGLSYLGVKDDPFDYANPDCTVKKTTVYADCASSSNNSSLMALLKSKAVTALVSAGYAATSGNTTLSTVKSIAVHTPMYNSPSKLYTKMDFTLTASTVTSGGASTTATVTVTCGIFTELESLLGMSIQSSKNELWSVVKSTSSFSLQARRYGHGLGMSQRGAMYMGKLGYTYDEILGFYFDGSMRVGCTFTSTILAAGSSTTVTTEETSATVDDTDTDGATTAVVKLVSSSGVLAIRETKSTTGSILGVVSNSSPVAVLASDGTWCLIKFGSIVGYVPANALTITGTPATSSDISVSSVVGFATVTASNYLNLRASGSLTASILTTAPTGAVLTVFSKTSSWAYVQYGATAAYASMDFLTISSTYSGAVVSTGSTTATVAADSGEVAYIRSTASTTGTVLAQLTAGNEVSVTRDDGSWAYVTFNSISGYMLSSSLTFGDDVTTVDDGDDDTDTTTEQTATVSTTVGYLRESADESATLLSEVAMGQSVVLISEGSTWCAVRYEGVSGYMLTASLTLPTQSGSTQTATVATQSGSLNMRQEASAGSTILTTIPKGATVTVVSTGTTWSAVTYGGLSGYVMSVYLQIGDTTTDTDTGSTTVQTTAVVTTASGSLNLRQLPKAGSTILTTIPRLATVDVYTTGTDWCNVTYSGTNGYVMTAFLTIATATATDTGTGEATATPEPTATVTPDETDTETDDTATVEPEVTATPDTLTAIVSTTSGSLNLREDMLPGSRILTRIPKGTTLTIAQKLEAWSQTTYNTYTGYVLNSYLTFPTTTTTAEDGTATVATVTTNSGSLNLRAQPYGTILTVIPQNATVQVLQHGSTWCYLTYNSISGYAMTAYLSFTQTDTTTVVATADTADTADTGTTLTATVTTPSGSLNMRAGMSKTSEIITVIPRLATVTMLEQGDTWCSVVYGAYTGYVQTTYLTIASTNDTDTTDVTATSTTATDETTTDETTETTAVTAWVYTASGSLNLRETASASAAVLAVMPRLAQVTLLTQEATWCKTQYGALTGYAMTAYLTTTQPAELDEDTTTATTTDAVTSDDASVVTAVTAAATDDPTFRVPDITLYATIAPQNTDTVVSLWSSCTESTGWLLDMVKDTQVTVLRLGDTWCEVLYFNQTGFCLTKGLKMFEQ